MGAVRIEAAGYRADVDLARGGSLLLFDWEGEALFRPVAGDATIAADAMLDVACFALVPFCNRIGRGRFELDGRAVRLPANAPAVDPRHAIHGYGWRAAWTVVEAGPAEIRIEHRADGSEWPWPYRAEQRLRLNAAGLAHALSIENLGGTPMPVGLGLHPFLPRNDTTIYHGLHRVEWRTGADGLPEQADRRATPRDWWDGAPIGTRVVDTVYGERAGQLRVVWPDRGMALNIEPSPELSFTHVYVPDGADFFCVEPVSHMPDAVNRREPQKHTGLRRLSPGRLFGIEVRYRAERPG